MKKTLKIAGIVLLALLLVVLAYVVYVFLSYHRIEDNLSLTPEGSASASVRTDIPYTVVSYNIGFGAYESDYSFFMDGGTESWAWSKERLDANLANIAQVLQKQNADFYFVQEVDAGSTRSYHRDESALLRQALPDLPLHASTQMAGAAELQLRLGAELRLPLPVLAADTAPRLLRFRPDDFLHGTHLLLPAP